MVESRRRIEYETWDEAFRGLSPIIRQQSVRVAAYAREIFLLACQDGFYKKDGQWGSRMRTQNADLVYKCGLYHQLGKSLVPPEYQIWREDFSQEELAVYRKYTSDGRLLVAILQERGTHVRGHKSDFSQEHATRNQSWLMVRETCQQHMERWNGSGYPQGLVGDQISPVAQIVGLAHELDSLVSLRRSEDPFSEAVAILESQADILWSPELMEVFRHSLPKCGEIYRQYIHYTLTIPKTIPLVEKREGRPLGLQYRPMVSDLRGTIVAYEAYPWFQNGPENGNVSVSMEEAEGLLERTGLLQRSCQYLLYEAADAVVRIAHCSLERFGILVHLCGGFFGLESLKELLDEIFENEGIQKPSLIFTIPEEVFLSGNEQISSNIQACVEAGYQFLLDGYQPEALDGIQLRELGFTLLRMAPDLVLKKSTADLIHQLNAQGFRVLGGGADTSKSLEWQLNAGMVCVSGTLTGPLMSEDELIRDALAREQAP